MILLIILLIPFITGLLLLLVRNASTVKSVALVAALANLLITLSLFFAVSASNYSVNWIDFLGTKFALGYDGISLIMLLLTNLLFPFIILAGFRPDRQRFSLLYVLLLFTQSALSVFSLRRMRFCFM